MRFLLLFILLIISQFGFTPIYEYPNRCYLAYGRIEDGRKIVTVRADCQDFFSRTTASVENEKLKRFWEKRLKEYQKHIEDSDEDYFWLEDASPKEQKTNLIIPDITPREPIILNSQNKGPSLTIIFDKLDYNDLFPKFDNHEPEQDSEPKEDRGDSGYPKNIPEETDPWLSKEFSVKLSRLGYYVADFYNSGQYDRFRQGIAGLGDVFSGPSDVFDEKIGEQANEILKSISANLLAKAKSHVDRISKSQTRTANANANRVIQKAVTVKNIGNGNEDISGVENSNSKSNASANLDRTKSRQQSFNKRALDIAASADKALAFSRSGLIDPTALNQFKEKAQKVVTSGPRGEGYRLLKIVRELANEGDDVALKEQYQKVYNSFVNDNGLVTTWLSESKFDQAPVFQTSITSPVGKTIRDVYNEALELEYKANDAFQEEKAGFALKWLQTSDRSFANKVKHLGNRYLNRARVLLDHETSHPRVQYYSQFQMTTDAMELFGIEVNTQTYMGYQMVDISGKFAKHQDLYQPSALNFITTQTFKQAHVRSKQQNIKSFGFFHDQLDNLYAIYDNFLNKASEVRHFLTSQTANDLAGGFIFGSEESIFVMDADGQVKKMGKENNAAFQTGRAFGLLIGGTAQVQFASTIGHGTGLLLDSTVVAVPAGIAVHAVSVGVTANGALAISKGTVLLASKGGNLMFSRRADSDRKAWNITNPEKTVYHPKFKNIYKDEKTGNWWSKDTAGHGDSKWKVFREVKKGLRWIADTDKFGTYIPNKHKSGVGKFISWKEIKKVN